MTLIFYQGAAVLVFGLVLAAVPTDRIIDRFFFDSAMPRHLVWLSSRAAILIGGAWLLIGLFVQ